MRWPRNKYYKSVKKQHQTQTPEKQEQPKHKHLVKSPIVHKSAELSLPAKNSLPILSKSQVSVLSLLTCNNRRMFSRSMQMKGVVFLTRFPFIVDVNLTNRDVSRITRLLSSMLNIVPAHSADCDILPDNLAKVLYILYVCRL